jgi:hypothetical protein
MYIDMIKKSNNLVDILSCDLQYWNFIFKIIIKGTKF